MSSAHLRGLLWLTPLLLACRIGGLPDKGFEDGGRIDGTKAWDVGSDIGHPSNPSDGGGASGIIDAMTSGAIDAPTLSDGTSSDAGGGATNDVPGSDEGSGRLRPSDSGGDLAPGADSGVSPDARGELETGTAVPGSLVDTPCDTPNSFGCDGAMSRLQLVCDSASQRWRLVGKCDAQKYCDRSTGDCASVVPECVGNQLGAHVCRNAALVECGPDLVTTNLIDRCDTNAGECARCRPLVIANGQQGASGILLHGDHVYWSAKAGIFRAPKIGGQSETVAANHQAYGALASDGVYLYWVDRQDNAGAPVMRVELNGGSPQTLASVAQGMAHPSLIVTGGYVYWSDSMGGSISRVPKDGGQAEVLLNPDSPDYISIVIDSGTIFMARDMSGTIMQMSADGGPTSSLASGQDHPGGIFVDSSFVYWTNYMGNQVMRVPRTGGSAEILATGQARPFAMVGDASYIYWVNQYGASVSKMRLTGGDPMTVASGFNSPGSLATDETSLCWTSNPNSGDSTVMCIQK